MVGTGAARVRRAHAGTVLLPPGPFTTAAALQAGIGRGVIDGPHVQRLLPGVHAAAGEVTLPTLVTAARLVLPADALLTGTSALRLAGVAVAPVLPLQFVSRHPHQVRREGVRVARVRALPPDRDGVVLPVPAFLSAATSTDLVELVTAGDHLVRTGRCSVDQLRAAAAAWSGRGARAARRAAALVRERVDSPRESELRLCLVLAGLPELEPNVVIGGADGPVGRFDLVHRALRVALEYEGDQHRTDPSQWNRDIVRHEQAAAEGWRLVRITAARAARPHTVVAVTLQALRAAGHAGPDPVFTPEWHRLFSSSARQLRLERAFDPRFSALGASPSGRRAAAR